jgi:hypothetical protein
MATETALDTWGRPRGRRVVAYVAARRTIFGWWAGSRAVVLACALVVHWIGRPYGYFGASAFRRPLGLLGQWDGHWYRAVAAHGYLLVPGRQSDPAFFPFFPILLHLVHGAGLSYLTAGLLIANVAFLPALLALRELVGAFVPTADADRAARYAAVAPAGFVFSMIYPESLVLAAVALAGWLALKRRWGLCAIAGAIAALARPEGALVAIPTAAAAWSSWRESGPAGRGGSVGAALAPLASVASFPLYLHWSLGDATAWQRSEQAWGRTFTTVGVLRALRGLRNVGQQPWLARDAAFFVLYVVLLLAAWRLGIPAAWLVFGALILLLPLGSGAFTSEMRFGLLAVPVYCGLAAFGRNRRLDRLLQAGMLVLLAAGTATIPLAFP